MGRTRSKIASVHCCLPWATLRSAGVARWMACLIEPSIMCSIRSQCSRFARDRKNGANAGGFGGGNTAGSEANFFRRSWVFSDYMYRIRAEWRNVFISLIIASFVIRNNFVFLWNFCLNREAHIYLRLLNFRIWEEIRTVELVSFWFELIHASSRIPASLYPIHICNIAYMLYTFILNNQIYLSNRNC